MPKMSAAHAGRPPEGLEVELSQAKVEVYDPDLAMVASAQAEGTLRTCEDIYFPDLQVTFDKGGTYVFLVSAWDKQYPGEYITNKAHEIRPLLQANKRLKLPSCVVVVDPGHGGSNVGATGAWAYENHDDHDKDQDLLQSERLESKLKAHKGAEYVHSNPSQRWIVYRPIFFTRRGNETVDFLKRVDKAAEAEAARKNQGIDWIVFISEHNNIAGTSNNESLVVLPPGGSYKGEAYAPPPGAQTLQDCITARLADTWVPQGMTRDYEARDTEENMSMLMMLWTDERTKHIPGVLIEQVNFQTPSDEDLLLTDDFPPSFAVQAHRGMDDFLVPNYIPGIGPWPY